MNDQPFLIPPAGKGGSVHLRYGNETTTTACGKGVDPEFFRPSDQPVAKNGMCDACRKKLAQMLSKEPGASS